MHSAERTFSRLHSSSSFRKRTPPRRSLSTVHASVGGFFVEGTQTRWPIGSGSSAGTASAPRSSRRRSKVVRAAGVALDTVDYDLGGARYLATGEVLPDAVLDELRGYDAILLGAVGTPEVPPGVLERGLLLQDALRARPLREPAAVQGRARAGTTTASTSSSSARTPKAPTRARAASCARARRTRSRRRAR